MAFFVHLLNLVLFPLSASFIFFFPHADLCMVLKNKVNRNFKAISSTATDT